MEKTNDLMELVNGCGVAKQADTSKVDSATETTHLLEELGFKRAAVSVATKLWPILKGAEIAAGGYIEITPEKINAFLQRKADDYNVCRPKQKARNYGGSITLTEDFGSISGAYRSLYNALAMQQTTSGTAGLQQSINQSINNDWSSVSTVTRLYDQVAVPPQRFPEIFTAYTLDQGTSAPGTIGRYTWTEVAVADYAGIPPIEVLKKFKDTAIKKLFDYFTVASVNAVRDPLLLGRVNGSQSRYFVAQWGDDVALDDVI